MITSATDLERTIFPPNVVIHDDPTEWHSPCPFCGSGPAQVHNGQHFYGTDRLVWFLETNTFYCRHCAAEGRGRNNNGAYIYRDFGHLFNLEVSDEIRPQIAEQAERELKPIRDLWSDSMVAASVRRVDPTFWPFWDASVLARFNIGAGVLYLQDGMVNTIPMRIQKPFEEPLDGWYVAGRRKGMAPKRTRGSSKPYVWRIVNREGNKLAGVIEGEKDSVSAAWLLPEMDVFNAFGVTTWTREKTEWIKSLGYTEVWALGDNDDPGYNFNMQVAAWCAEVGLACRVIDWAESPLESGGDITDLLSKTGYTTTRQYILDHVYTPRVMHVGGVVKGHQVRYDNPVPNEEVFITALDKLRGRGEGSLYHEAKEFLDSYANRTKRGAGAIKLLAAPPGAGKTNMLVNLVEELARESLVVKRAEYARLQSDILQGELTLATNKATWSAEETQVQMDVLARMRRKLDEFSFATIAFFGMFKEGFADLQAVGADDALWYNYDARNLDNCANFPLAAQLGRNGHQVGLFCQKGCPLRDACAVNGYLSQERERRQKPITFFRHEHLYSEVARTYKQLLVIDENPTRMIDGSPTIFKAKDVYPARPGWELDLDRDSAALMENFAAAVRAAMSTNLDQPAVLEDGEYNPQYQISGAAFLNIVDRYLQASTKYDLQTAVEGASQVVEAFQPNYISGDLDTIKLRCMAPLVKAIARELGDYTVNPENRQPSCLHLVAGTLHVFGNTPPLITHNVPIIVADATPMAPLYEAMFGRRVEAYVPEIRNPNAVTVVVNGSDWTRGSINQQIGTKVAERKRAVMHVETILHGTIDIGDAAQFDEDLYGSKILDDAVTIIKGLAEKHKTLLVVTHKSLRELLEEVMVKANPSFSEQVNGTPRVAWGHYGALRGTNRYKEFEAVVLIGVHRIPYDVMYRRASTWARLLGEKDPISPVTVIRDKPYTPDGKLGHGYRSFGNPFADRYVCAIEEGEIEQAATRIRPHSSTLLKTIYFFGSRPALRHVTHIVAKTAFVNHLKESKHTQIRRFILEYREKNGRLPTYSLVRTQFAVSDKTIRQILKNLDILGDALKVDQF